MSDFDDLDSLLELESQLAEDGDGGQKRSRADLQSQADAAACLSGAGAAPDSSSKRPRVAGGAPSLQTFRGMAATEEQALLALAADSQPASQSVLGGAATTTVGGVCRTFDAPTVGHLAASEEQALLAVAAGSQPSQSVLPGRTSVVVGGSRLGGGRPSSFMPAGGDDMDEDLDAILDELLDEEAGEQQQQQQEQGNQRTPAAAARPAAGAVPAAVPAAAPPAATAQQAQQGAEWLLPPRQYVPPAKEVYRIRGASLTVTSQSGERVYCSLEAPPVGGNRRLDVAGALRRVRGGLLSDPIEALLAAVEKDQYERAVAETTTAAAATARGASTSPPGGRRGSGPKAGQAAGRAGRSSLWVEQYAPRGYTDLLSDEQINREVVRWLKGWDPCVFGTADPGQMAQQARGMGSRQYKPAGGTPWQQGGGGCRGGDGGSSGNDQLGRPEHKIILIAGPPGLGKTTLAHVCAAHCGYRPVEINASDDRSGTSLQAKILDAVEMQSVMGERRPNCVIIDEIDGAAGGAEGRSGIAALIKIVNAAPSKARQAGNKAHQQRHASGGGDVAESDSEDEGEEGGGNNAAAGTERQVRGAARRGGGGGCGSGKAAGRTQLRPLLRPIIAICNDLYAPALRPLRDVAKVFNFRKPQPERLVQRLQAVCAAEGLRCEKSTLRLLVERTDCDVRSCLNTLQFLAKKQSVVRQADLAGLRVGQKDMTKGAFAVWTELLQKRKAPGIIGRAAETEAQRAARLYHTLQDFGEADLVMGGVHENVLGLRYFDLGLQRTTAVMECLGDADRLLRACHRCGDFGILKYVPAPLVALSNLVAQPDRPQLQWPRAGFDAARRLAANQALLHGWMLGLSPSVAVSTSGRSMALEVLPALMYIAAPALRPVSQHLYHPAELEVVRRLVGTMLHYNLRYCLEPSHEEVEEEQRREAEAAAAAERGDHQQQQQRVRGGVAEPPLRFRPAVHRACTFPGMAPKGRALPAAVRQTLSHEADMEVIRRAEVARRGGSASPPPAGDGALAAANRPGGPAQRGGVVPLTLAERMKASGMAAGAAAKAAAAAPKGTWLDALKEQRQARAGAAGGREATRNQNFPVLYKFLEGCTNAVKRPVLMRDLL